MSAEGDADVGASSSKRARTAETPATVAARPKEVAMPNPMPKALPVDATKIPIEELVPANPLTSAARSHAVTLSYPKPKAKPVDAPKIPTEELVPASIDLTKAPIQEQVNDAASVSSGGSYHDDLVDVPQEEDWDPYLSS